MKFLPACLFVLLLLSCATGYTQPSRNDYAAAWKKVQEFDKKGLPKSALVEVVKIFEDAVAKNNEPQQIKAAMYQMKYRNMVEEDNKEKNIFYLDSLIAKTKAPAKNILQSMQATVLLNYKNQNRYRLYNQTALATENSRDITTWSLEMLQRTITALFTASLQNEAILKKTSLSPYEAVLEKGNSRNLRPTLYDLLAHRALDYFMSTENDVTSPSFKFILNDERIFLPAKQFSSVNFQTKDTSSLYYHALLILQDLVKFHLNDANADALLDIDLKRLAFAHEHGVFPDDHLYEAALKNISDNFASSPVSAEALYLRALLYYNAGQKYNPLTHPGDQYKIKEAIALLEEAYKRYPKSNGGIHAWNLLQQLKQPAIGLQTELVNIPGQPFRSLLSFKNASKVYLRVIKITHDEIRNNYEDDNVKRWQQWTDRKPLKEWSQNLPVLNDYQQHSTEIKIDALPTGIYMILASLDAGFSISENILLKQVAYVSNISYLLNDKNNLFVLDRDNGSPLQGAKIQLWQQNYDYSLRRYNQVKEENYTADKNGFAKLAMDKKNNQHYLQITHNGDELFTDEPYYNYFYDGYKPKGTNSTFLFTDRSIYRPGQTVFFKGIMINTSADRRTNNIMPRTSTVVWLYDANNQKKGPLSLTSNEDGSYNGSFALPEGQLNGQYYLMDSVTKSTKYFSVEEYKRPTFSVDIQKPSGTYRINDSIPVKGLVKAYAGNNIGGAAVTYRVVRKVRYPFWFYSRIWPPYGQTEAMEITNGTTTTNSDGEFTITFKAIPDESIDKKNQPVFYYEVSADVTDQNGETRSSSTSVSVSWQALQLAIAAPDRIAADSIKSIKIKSTNINDIFEKAKVNVQVQALVAPGKIYRKRYWEMPDQFVIEEASFKKDFPYDPYRDEDQVSKWASGKKVIDVTDTTAADGHFNLPGVHLQPGWYKITATTTDKYGEVVKAEKFVQVSTTGKTQEAFSFIADKSTAQPGETVKYNYASGFDNVWLIQHVTRSAEDIQVYYESLKNNFGARSLAINESDRGGINLDFAFVQHNRVYNYKETIAVPWMNKDLNITYETFRDKTLPGSNETWKIKISGVQGEKLAAEALLSMYDASLDQFKPPSWDMIKNIWPTNAASIRWGMQTFKMIMAQENSSFDPKYIDAKETLYDALINNGWNEGYYNRGRGRDLAYASPAANERVTDAQMSEVVVTSALAGKVAGVQVGNEEKESSQTDSVANVNPGQPVNAPNNESLRKNFNETAFFFPALETDAKGNISFSFTVPEALTTWRMMSLAHTKDLASGYAETNLITQKPLMARPNAPRFFREGDQMEFSVQLVNTTDKEMTGTAQFELLDAATNKPVDGWFKNVFPNQYFTVAAGQTFVVKFPMTIPYNFGSALTYRIKATTKDGSYSDGEEAIVPVLTNRTLVTETFPINMRRETTKTFRFDKLLNADASGTLSHQALTVEYTSNPAWYAVQALPYLMEYPYECAEQNFNRYYANVLAAHISNSMPRIKAVFEKWKTLDTAALLSNLQKNQELKSALLEETPWVLQAQNETQQKKQIAMLFDMVKLATQKESAVNKLKDMQSSNGGFTWFKGGPDDRYITQYIITGIGHLQKLNALTAADKNMLQPIIDKAIPYLDARIKEDYDYLVSHKVKLTQNNLSAIAIQYLYMRSFFNSKDITSNAKTAVNYYSGQAATYWLSQSKYLQGMIALAMQRKGDEKIAKDIVASLKENSITHPELGMYWKDFTTGGYYWMQAPIESQALMIEVFTDIDKNNATIGDMKTWLLKNKQTNQWPTTKATAEACYALLLNGSNWLAEEKTVTIQLGNSIVSTAGAGAEAGTGYIKKTFPASQVKQGMGNINVKISNAGTSTSTSWGAVYWQYFEDLDKITSAATPLQLTKNLFIERNSPNGPKLIALKDGDELSVGDKIKVRIVLKVDRDMEYIHMKDMRAACMEPVNVISGYKWQGGLGYYESTKDASTNFFFGRLPRGSYVFEYPMFVTHSGNFSNGITTIQCMYAPEFSSHSEGVRVTVK